MNFDDTLSLAVNGQAWQGWESVRVTRGIERMPSDFVVSATERFPNDPGTVDLQPGQDVVVRIGGDVVLTGYLDRYAPMLTARSHGVEITGRGRCQDLVDCSAVFTGQQIMQSTALGIAQTVARPFGIDVKQQSGGDRPIYQFNTVLTESPYSVIERVTRFSGLLAYEGTDGNMILATVGTDEMASGFAEGVNVEACRAMFSMDQRFSDITVILTSIDTQWHNNQTDGAIGVSAANTVAKVQDKTVPRYRPRVVVSEQQDDGFATAIARANWEVARRYGRSQMVNLTCDSWRDSAGKLWEPNALVAMDLPSLKLPGRKWIISEVTFSKAPETGTTAELVLMPPDAFNPEPILLYPFDWQVGQNQPGGGSAG